MNRFAAAHPEDWEERLDGLTDYSDAREKVGNEPCPVCGEVTTRGGVTCNRCWASLEEERLDKETQGF